MKRILLVAAAVMALLASSSYADPPAAVTDLAIAPGYSTAAAVFTVPDGANYYEVKYWDSTMNEVRWGGYYTGASGWCTANTTVCAVFNVNDNCHAFKWAVRVSCNNCGGWSTLSNQPSVSTRCAPNYSEAACP